MRVVEKDPRAKRLKLQLETPEDLYFISLLIDEGDVVTAWTTRQIRIDTATGSRRGDRVRVKLSIKVKKVEFQRFSDSVRVLGVVIEAPEWLSALGTHHTIGLRVGDEIEIVKESFLRYHEKILDMAIKLTKIIGIISIDFDEVAAAALRPQGLEILSVVNLPRPGKEGSIKDHLKSRLSDVIPQLVSSLKSKGCQSLLIAAPKLVLEVVNEMGLPASRLVDVSEGGLSGLYELLRSGSLTELVADEQLLTAKQALRELLERLQKTPGRVALGPDEVLKALEVRAVEALLMLDEALLGEKRGMIREILDKAPEALHRIIVVPPTVEGADLLRKSGGVAALLYYSVNHKLGSI